MSQVIIDLYEELIDKWHKYHIKKRTFTVPGWYQNYKYMHNCVYMPMRHRLKAGYKLDADRDEEFLRWLIYESCNSISDSGMSYFEWKNYDALVRDQKFINLLMELMIDPSATRLDNLGVYWKNFCKSNNPLRIRRIAAACTTKLSSTVDPPKFNKAYNFFVTQNIISTIYVKNNSFIRWFARNEQLMEELHKIFKNKIATGETDSFKLSIFVWEIYYQKEHNKTEFATLLNKIIQNNPQAKKPSSIAQVTNQKPFP